jgi:hypothetical protein
MRIKQLLESATTGGTSSASVATVAKGSKGMIKRQKPTDNALDSGKLFQETNAAEGKEDKIAQLKKDHDTAVHWSKNETSPQKREAARQKAEKIKRHLDTQYKQGVAEVSDATLTSYLTKLDKDNLKHRMDPTKRSDTKRMKSGPNFVKAFTKLDNRKQGVAEATGDEKFDKSMRKMTGKITPGDADEMWPTQEFEPVDLDPSYLPSMEKYKAKLFPLAYQYWTDGDNADELRALGWEPDYGDDYVMVVLSGIGHDGHIQYDKYDFDAEDENNEGVAEVAPPGAKAERMVKHIKKGYAKDGKLTKTEKSKAYGAAWKAHNAGKVEEQSVEENKKGVRAVKHAVKPRNFVAKNAVQSGAGAHKDKKKAQKQGDVKHKAKEPAYESKLWAALDRRIIK